MTEPSDRDEGPALVYLGSHTAQDSIHETQLCESCPKISYVVALEAGGVEELARLRGDGWKPMSNSAGLARPCAVCLELGLPPMPPDPMGIEAALKNMPPPYVDRLDEPSPFAVAEEEVGTDGRARCPKPCTSHEDADKDEWPDPTDYPI